MNNHGLEERRREIDRLDEELIRLLNERIRLAVEIGKLKHERDEEIYVPARERKVLERIASQNKGPLSDEALRAIYREIMSAALALEHDLVIAYLGPKATFTHMAARMRFGSNVRYRDFDTISDVFSAVTLRKAHYGVVPIENSTEGAVSHTLDEFLDTPLKICAEIYMPIAHHLMARVRREEIRRIYSNPQVFGQCRRWLNQNMSGIDLVPVSSTARAAERAAGEKGSAAIAGALAAELYGLEVIEDNIQDLAGNTTRFLVIARRYGDPTGDDKTSILFGVKHEVGALYEALGAFRNNGINMTKIESRPSRQQAWEYYFFVDIEGHVRNENVQRALTEMGEHCTLLRILGSYPRDLENVSSATTLPERTGAK